jgi:dihydrolipoamide dehydrogenase
MLRLSFDLAVVGAGEAGIAAAVRASELGARVALIEKSRQLGGACVATGTLPSKVLSLSTGMLEVVNKAKNFGIRVEGGFALDFKEIQAGRARLTRCDVGTIQSELRAHRVEVVRGAAAFIGERLVRVAAEDENASELEARKVVVAAGSRPAEIPGLSADGRSVLTTDDFAGLRELPASIVIVGAGYVGCEYAFILRTLGLEVSLIEKLDHPLAGQDAEIVALIEREMKRKGIRFLGGTTVTGCGEAEAGRLRLATDRGQELVADMALVCAGRRPSTDGLNLDAAHVGAGPRGEVLVDRRLETTARGVYAAGDILGRAMLSSTAILEGAVAAGNAMGEDRELDERIIPTAIYTQPEMGSVGMTEDAARRAAIPYIKGVCPYARLVKACAVSAHSSGLIKLIFEADTHRLLGAHILGTEAAELIHALALALKLGVTAEDLVYSVYHHPSFSEGFREAAAEALRQKQGVKTAEKS